MMLYFYFYLLRNRPYPCVANRARFQNSDSRRAVTQLDVNSSPIPNHYIFRRLLNVKGNIEQDKTPVFLRNHAQPAPSNSTTSSSGSSSGEDRSVHELPDPRYLALHAAIGGVLVKSGCVFYVIRLFEEFRQARTLAPDGSSNVVHLFASHSIGKVSRCWRFILDSILEPSTDNLLPCNLALHVVNPPPFLSPLPNRKLGRTDFKHRLKLLIISNAARRFYRALYIALYPRNYTPHHPTPHCYTSDTLLV